MERWALTSELQLRADAQRDPPSVPMRPALLLQLLPLAQTVQPMMCRSAFALSLRCPICGLSQNLFALLCTPDNHSLKTGLRFRYARDVAVADTHDNNLILIGSESFNPWVTLYHPAMDFEAHWDYKTDVYTVVNRAQASGDSASYSYNRRDGEVQKALTHIALVDNAQGQGRVLIVEGTSMGTTYGAVNFLTHETLWGPVMKRATDSSGHICGFDLLLSGNFVHGAVSNSQVLALHVH
jgi:hypothetical protein